MSLSSVILKLSGLALALFSLLLGVAILRTVLLQDIPVSNYCSPDENFFFSDKLGASKRLSNALKFKTVSYSHHVYEQESLSKFASYISKSFPLVHSSPIVSQEVINNLSLLYHIKGSNKNLKPYMLLGHLDVVPVEESKWDVDPFGGQIRDGFIWGRGAMDCKHVVMGIMETIEFLLSKGYKPERSFYVGFGHDEEVNGLDGAQHISQLLESQNIKLEYILDEGSFIFDNLVPTITSPLALVSVSEKGSLNVKLNVEEDPGHSSLPDKENAIIILSKALSKLEGYIFPSMMGYGPEKEMLEHIGFAAAFPLKVILTNLWLFKPLLIGLPSPIMNAFHRTTTAVTVVNGGTKVNIIPSSASALVNFRIHPAQTIEEVVDYVMKVINDDRVHLSVESSFPPHPVSPSDSFGYMTIKNSIQQIYNDSKVVPCTLIANTDTKWYLNLTDSIYRFSFVRITVEDVKRVHGHNERISVDNYADLINFFVHLIKNSDKPLIKKHVHTDL